MMGGAKAGHTSWTALFRATVHTVITDPASRKVRWIRAGVW